MVLISGERKEFKVMEMTQSHLIGKNDSIEIDNIIALETREFSGGKSALLAGGIYGLYGLLTAMAVSIMIGF